MADDQHTEAVSDQSGSAASGFIESIMAESSKRLSEANGVKVDAEHDAGGSDDADHSDEGQDAGEQQEHDEASPEVDGHDAGEPESDQAPKAKPDTDAEQTDRVNRAIAFAQLRRLGLKDAALKTLEAVPLAELQAVADNVKEQLKHHDGMGNKVKDLERQLAEAKAKPAPAPETPDSLKALMKHLEDQGESEMGKLLTNAIGDLTKQIQDGKNEIETLKKSTSERPQQVTDAQLLVEFREPLDRVARLYPKAFDTPEKRVALLKTADKLVSEGVFDGAAGKLSADDIFDRTAALLTGKGGMRTAQQELAEQQRRERSGQVKSRQVGSGTSAARPQPKNWADQVEQDDRETLRLIRRGMSPSKAQERLRARSAPATTRRG